MAPHFKDLRRDDIRRSEYGSRRRTLAAYALVAMGTVLLSMVVDWHLVLAWGLAYVFAEGCTAGLLHGQVPRNPPLRYWLSLVSYVARGLIFMSLPFYLIAVDSPPALCFAAGSGLVGVLLFTLQRTHLAIELVIADSLRVGLLTLGLVAVMLGKLDQTADMILVVFSAIASAGFYIGSLVAGWHNQRELREAQNRYAIAQKARALGQFAGGVAHDFNNQLTAILGNLDLFDELEEPADRDAALHDCRVAAERAALTVQQLLATTGRTRLWSQPLAMEGFLYQLAEVLGDLLDPDMEIEVQPPEEPLVAQVDRDILETCAIQLCLNAQDATRGAGRVLIRTERRRSAPSLNPAPEAPPPYIVLIIEDNGPGVPADALPYLAEPFYTTKGATEGTGLGLAAVAGFARQSGGGLMLQAAPQGGLSAQIYLRESDPATAADATDTQKGSLQLSGS